MGCNPSYVTRETVGRKQNRICRVISENLLYIRCQNVHYVTFLGNKRSDWLTRSADNVLALQWDTDNELELAALIFLPTQLLIDYAIAQIFFLIFVRIEFFLC